MAEHLRAASGVGGYEARLKAALFALALTPAEVAGTWTESEDGPNWA